MNTTDNSATVDSITGWAAEYELHHQDRDGYSVPRDEPTGLWAPYFTGDEAGDPNSDLLTVKQNTEGRIRNMAERLGVYMLTFHWIENYRDGTTWHTVGVTVHDFDD